VKLAADGNRCFGVVADDDVHMLLV
jgi:hypothetical protein